MEIAVSGKFSKDVFDEAYDITYDLRNSIAASGVSDIESGIDTFAFYAVILSDDLEVGSKSRRYFSQKENSEIVNREIPHAAWCATDRCGKIALLIQSIKAAIADTASKKINDTAKELIATKLDEIQNKLYRIGGPDTL